MIEPTKEFLDNLSKQWNDYDDQTKNEIANNLAGSYKQASFKVLMDVENN